MKKTDEPIIIQITTDSSPDDLWSAISDVEKMRLWYFDNIATFKAEPGFETQFDVKVEDRLFRHVWRIIDVIPRHKLTYTWRYEDYVGSAIVSFVISGLNEKTTLLHFTCEVVEDFQENVPEFTRESALAGWQYLICESLKTYLDNLPKES
jgi:uncharacterized protein YndB with AHSA1/START domain